MLNNLATSRRRGCNIIIANRDVLNYLKKCTLLEDNARSLFSSLEGKSHETWQLKKSVSRYYTIISQEDVQCENYYTMTVEELLEKEFASKTKFLAENLSDCRFYNYIGLYYAYAKNINHNVSFDPTPGGGHPSATLFKTLIEENNNLLFGIFDGDQKYPGDNIGETLEAVLKVIDSKDRKFFDCLSLADQGVHEAENLIPLGVIEEIYDGREADAQNTIKFLNRLYYDKSNLYFYFDMKKGVYRDNQKYTNKDRYDACWKDCVESFKKSENLEKIRISKVIISQSDLLDKAIEYLSEKSSENNKDLIVIFENFVKNTFVDLKWTEIGKEIFTWGCVGRRIS